MKPIRARPRKDKRKMMTWIFYPARSLLSRIVSSPFIQREKYIEKRKRKKEIIISLFQDSRVRPVFIHPGIKVWVFCRDA
jgi:hypothetical protein